MNSCAALNYFCDVIISPELVRWEIKDQLHVTKDRFDEETALYIANILRAAFAVPDALINLSTDSRYGTYKKATNTRIIIRSINPCIKKIEKAFATLKDTTSSRKVESILDSADRAPFELRLKLQERCPWLRSKRESAHALLKEGHFILCSRDLSDYSPLVDHITQDDLEFITDSLQQASISSK